MKDYCRDCQVMDQCIKLYPDSPEPARRPDNIVNDECVIASQLKGLPKDGE